MRAASALVRTKVIRADDYASYLGDKGAAIRAQPVGERVGTRHVSGKSKGLTVAQNGFKQPPNGICIFGRDKSDTHLWSHGVGHR
jgi:hypothetical protein